MTDEEGKARIDERTRRTEWFRKARFGMFIHWGLYSIPARGEWVRSMEEMSIEDYEPFFQEFNPSDYDPKEWARLAKNAGMKYAVLTAKHHDGFCLFDSKLTDYKSTNTPCHRDLVREYVDAFREAGLKVGLYYSLLDWHHPDYPHYQDRNHPMRNHPEESNENRCFDRYLEYMHGQVRELLTNYGKIDIMWFDFSYPGMENETWHATELVNMARSLQPDLIIDNRLEGSGEKSGSIKTKHPSVYAGDFACPEQMIPPEGLTDEDGDPIPWEACITMNDNWGYSAADHHFKPTRLLIRSLVECVSKGGNLILNVGPNAKGQIPEESVRRLEEIGEWMKVNSASIYNCGHSDYPKPEWGRFTQNGSRLYAHILDENVNAICLPELAGQIDSMRLLQDGSEIKETDFWNVKEYPDDAFFFLANSRECTFPLPDERDTVVEIRLK